MAAERRRLITPRVVVTPADKLLIAAATTNAAGCIIRAVRCEIPRAER
jgi:hypothetical protein